MYGFFQDKLYASSKTKAWHKTPGMTALCYKKVCIVIPLSGFPKLLYKPKEEPWTSMKKQDKTQKNEIFRILLNLQFMSKNDYKYFTKYSLS